MTNTRSTTSTRLTTMLAMMAALLLAATLFAPPGNASTEGGPDDPVSDASGNFTLTISPESGDTKVAWLTCNTIGIPPTHPDAEAACRQLSTVDGYVERIPPLQDMYCPDIYDPTTVTAEGQWNGEERSYRATFPNECVAMVSTGGVLFAF